MVGLQDEISFPTEWTEPHPLFGTYGSIDHTHIRIGRSRYDQKRYYRADKGHAIIAQVTVDRIGKIIHISAGYRGNSNDQLVLSLSNVMSLLGETTRMCTDGGFSSGLFGSRLVTPSAIEGAVMQHFQKVERVIVECTIGFMKRYDILSSRFRFSLPLFPVVVIVCGLLTNLYLEGHPIRTKEYVRQRDQMQLDRVYTMGA